MPKLIENTFLGKTKRMLDAIVKQMFTVPGLMFDRFCKLCVVPFGNTKLFEPLTYSLSLFMPLAQQV